MNFTIADVVRFTGGTLSGAATDNQVLSGASTDSRTIQAGQLFVAYRGEERDGHDFAAAACARGAGALLVERPIAAPSAAIPQVVVADPRAALAQLANRVLARSSVEMVVGVTGSAGKTTTRELIVAVLEAGNPGSVLRPPASYNTDTGLSMTILNGLAPDHRYAVLEMGAQRTGEIAALCRLAPPHIAVVTNVGGAHLEFFGSLDAVATAKGELVEAVPLGGLAVLNGDDPRVRAMVFRSRAPAVLYGVAQPADYRGRCLGVTTQGMRIEWEGPNGRGDALLRLIGQHNLLNALAAVAVAERCSVDGEAIRRGLESVAPVHSRLEPRAGPGGSVVIDDSYNANRVSMLAGLATLAQLAPAGHRIAVLGDMYELGVHAEAEHRAVGAAAAEMADRLIAIGDMAQWIAAGAQAAGMPAARITFLSAPGDQAFRSASQPHAAVAASRQSIAAGLRPELGPQDVVLVKAARGMRLDYLVDLLTVPADASAS